MELESDLESSSGELRVGQIIPRACRRPHGRS